MAMIYEIAFELMSRFMASLVVPELSGLNGALGKGCNVRSTVTLCGSFSLFHPKISHFFPPLPYSKHST